MKKFNLRLLTIMLAVFSVTLLSCDDEESSKDNSFSYNGTTYKIAAGFLENYGAVIEKSVSSYNLDLTFATSGITYNTETGDISGIGSMLYFEMFTTSGTQLVPGTYSFDLYETTNAGTFDYAELAINYNFATETGTYVDFVAGTVVVKLTETTYEITINLTSTENKVLTGYFKGTLTYVDLTEMPVKSNHIKPFKR
ncbi:MAG: hypothetical protein RBT49_08380 [Bacteroidales bacterium]|jgi:hypothetical protein|nr:hypothetical protein [Bacteroidales bacterium]